jgi:hypothetical protein
MFDQMKQQRPEQCVSDLRFDALAAGEIDETGRRALEQHVASCIRCQARGRALAELRERFDAQQPGRVPADRRDWADRSASGVRAKPLAPARSWSLAATVAVAAAAAGTLAFVAIRDASRSGALPTVASATERAKGSEHIGFFIKRGDQVQRGTREQSVQPGDQLRFLYSAPRARYLAIVSLDSARQVSVFYPASERAERIEPGIEVALPSAVALDGTGGEERVYALFCDTPVELAGLRSELGKQGVAFAAPAGCVMDRLMLRRESGAERDDRRPVEENAP